MNHLSPFGNLDRYKASAWALIAVNCLPLVGAVFLAWDAFDIVLLYWCENVVIGAINVLKMLACSPDAGRLVLGDVDPNDKLNRERMQRSRGSSVATLRFAHHASKLFFVPFFTFHYGLFCVGHGVVIFEIFGRRAGGFGFFGPLANLPQVLGQQHLWWCVVALALSHLWSFALNYIGRGEYRRSTVPVLMFQPYARIVVLHVAILFGGFIAFTLGSNILVLAMLVAGKTLLDLGLHLMQRSASEAAEAKRDPNILPEVSFPG